MSGRIDRERDERTRALLAEAHRGGRAKRRRIEQRVVLDYVEVADAVANRYRGTGLDIVELRQVAYLGLTKAVKRFDPARKRSIVAFAVPTIDGEIKHYLRDASWAVRPPRSLQELSLELNARIPELTQELGRRPTVDDLEEAIGRPADEIAEALRSGLGRVSVSLSAPVAGGGPRQLPLSDTLWETDEGFERVELGLLVAQMLASLTPAERRLVRLRFFLDLTQAEIAARLDMSQMQVSRALTRVLALLRSRFDRMAAPAY